MDGDRSYRRQATDTSLAIEHQLIEAWRAMNAAEKVARFRALSAMVRQIARAGVRQRHPGASDREVALRLASLVVDRATMVRLLAWDPEREGYG